MKQRELAECAELRPAQRSKDRLPFFKGVIKGVFCYDAAAEVTVWARRSLMVSFPNMPDSGSLWSTGLIEAAMTSTSIWCLESEDLEGTGADELKTSDSLSVP